MTRRVLAIAWNREFVAAIVRYVRSALDHREGVDSTGERAIPCYVLPADASQTLTETFQAICAFIEGTGGFTALQQTSVLVEFPLLDVMDYGLQPNPLSTAHHRLMPEPSLLCALVLAFPEVRWLFYSSNQGDLSEHRVSAESLRDQLTTTPSRLLSLFDPRGLRARVRAHIVSSPVTPGGAKSMPVRTMTAAAIDDEEGHAFLNAYLAYRLGYRCFLITTEAMMDEVLGRVAGRSAGGQASVSLTFEDVFLNFPDKTSDERHLSNLQERDASYPVLAQADTRVFVTSDHEHIAWASENNDYKAELTARGRSIVTLSKPTGGLYDILRNGGLLTRYEQIQGAFRASSQPGTQAHGADAGHGAVGWALMIAERMIARAEAILYEGRSPQDYLHGAMLALEAQELVGYRTPTTSLQAIALRHRLETRAECTFYGIGYARDINSRLDEIRDEVDTVAQWMASATRRRSSLSAQLTMVTEVTRILRDSGQFDEEQRCLTRMRKLHRQLAMTPHARPPRVHVVAKSDSAAPSGVVANAIAPDHELDAVLQPILARAMAIISWPARVYVEALLASVPLFVMALLGWPVVLGLVGYVSSAEFGELGPLTRWNSVVHSFIMFYGLAPSAFPKNLAADAITLVTVMLGFVHLGIFISHLYTLMSRR